MCSHFSGGDCLLAWTVLSGLLAVPALLGLVVGGLKVVECQRRGEPLAVTSGAFLGLAYGSIAFPLFLFLVLTLTFARPGLLLFLCLGGLVLLSGELLLRSALRRGRRQLLAPWLILSGAIALLLGGLGGLPWPPPWGLLGRVLVPLCAGGILIAGLIGQFWLVSRWREEREAAPDERKPPRWFTNRRARQEARLRRSMGVRFLVAEQGSYGLAVVLSWLVGGGILQSLSSQVAGWLLMATAVVLAVPGLIVLAQLAHWSLRLWQTSHSRPDEGLESRQHALIVLHQAKSEAKRMRLVNWICLTSMDLVLVLLDWVVLGLCAGHC